MPVRSDGYLHNGDGGTYWWMTAVLPGFRQFRYPAKLFTFTALGMTALAGLGWDRLAAGRGRKIPRVFLMLLALTLIALVVVVSQKQSILGSISPGMARPCSARSSRTQATRRSSGAWDKPHWFSG